MPGLLKGYLGAIAGAAIGYFVFNLMLQQGFYALSLPGAAIGLMCGYLSGVRSVHLAVICGILSLALCLYVEWENRPFVADPSLSFFLSNLGDLTGTTKVLLGVGTLFGAWFGLGRDRFVSAPRTNTQTDNQF